MMINRYTLALFVAIFSVVFFCEFSMAKEDTAQITLKKTATSKQKLYTYTVKKGDMISTLLRQIPNVNEEGVKDNYKLVKDLNPDISNLNKLHAGQLLVLPWKPLSEAGQNKIESKTEDKSAASLTPLAKPASGNTYAIKKGDNLIKIIHRELKIKTNTRQILKVIQSINPKIVDVNRIYAGQTIKLPGQSVFVKAAEEEKTTVPEVLQDESQTQPEEIIELKEKIVMPPEARLALIKHVITQMNGSIMTTGNYYLPIPKTGQITIDCSKIPVIEFDDQTTMFLDLDNRAEDNLKKIISDNWANYSLIKVDKRDDVIAVFKKIFNAAKGYSITKKDTPMTIGTLPPVDLIVDWVITKSNSKQLQPLIQGLTIVYGNNPLLPKSIKNYAQKNGLIITEFSEETGVVGGPEEIYSLPPMPVFPATSVKDFSYALISYLGFKADKNSEVKVFDIVKDGFNLSIKADVLVKSANKRYIIYSRILPAQFVKALKKAGYEIIFVAETDTPKVIMEKILPGLNVIFASGYFTFSGIDKNQAPYLLSFQGTKIKTDTNLYIIDFEIDQGLRSMLRETWAANIGRY
ncbi:MAG: LysM peptidoglycan-binding domain-containing protein [Deltaproteobacteria bacterium]